MTRKMKRVGFDGGGPYLRRSVWEERGGWRRDGVFVGM